MRGKSLKYSTSGNIEAEYEVGGRVLKNRLGIRSKKQMDRLEYEALLKTQDKYYHLVTPETRFTAKLICSIHKDFFGSLYPWAGKYRTVNVEKGGFKWPPAYLVAKNMADFEKDALSRHTPCQSGPMNKVAEALAIVHAELLLVHPFREGNGRLARLVTNLMALQAGHAPLDFGFKNPKNRRRYLEAVKQGYLGNHGLLKEMVEQAVKRGEGAGGSPL